MNTKINIPTHVGTGHTSENNQYTTTQWLRRDGAWWVRYDQRDSDRKSRWACATGQAECPDITYVQRVTDVRALTNQDKHRWLQDRLIRLEATLLHGHRERDTLQRSLDEMTEVLSSTAQHCNDLRQALEELP